MSPRHLRPLAWSLAAAAILALSPGGAGAQRAVVRGRVVAADSARAPLSGAEVTIPSLARTTRTEADGSFELGALPAGSHELLARRVGHDPATRSVTLGAADTVTVELTLGVRAQALTQVDVRDRAAAPAVRAFERERARSNGGAFVSDSLLARNEHASMSSVLRRIPGAAIVRYQSRTGAYNTLGSARGRQSVRNTEKYCFFQVYVDGQRRFAPSSPQLEPPLDVDEFKVSDYEAIEVYRGAGQTPSQYGGTGAPCGTILFWSRTRR